MLTEARLMDLYTRLYAAYGPQQWWPAESAFEVVVGAVLTQNTAWTNVVKAIGNLKQAGLLDLGKIHQIQQDQLARLIRPSGYYNIKAKRLQNVCSWLVDSGGMDALSELSTDSLRSGLLTVNGIGPETADDILLYAWNRPVFVIDTYTRRLLVRLGLIQGNEDYELLRGGFEKNLPRDPVLYNEYHALVVRHAKEICISTADCRHCRVESARAGVSPC